MLSSIFYLFGPPQNIHSVRGGQSESPQFLTFLNTFVILSHERLAIILNAMARLNARMEYCRGSSIATVSSPIIHGSLEDTIGSCPKQFANLCAEVPNSFLVPCGAAKVPSWLQSSAEDLLDCSVRTNDEPLVYHI